MKPSPLHGVSVALFGALVCVFVSFLASSYVSGTTSPFSIGKNDLSKYPTGSPEKSLMEWFQEIQLGDAESVRARIMPRELDRVAPKTVNFAVRLVGQSIGFPEIVSTEVDATRAYIHVLIRGDRTSGHETGPTARTFLLERVATAWKLADVSYLIKESDSVLAHQ
jgi:hypothetical protein